MKPARQPTKQQKKEKEKNRSESLDRIHHFSSIEADKFLADIRWIAIEVKKAEKALLRDRLTDLNGKQTQEIGRFSEDAFIDRSERGLTPEQSAEKMIRPLASAMKSLAERMFLNVLGDILLDPDKRKRDLFLKAMSGVIGTKGGRKAGVHTKHIIWLKEILDVQERLSQDELRKLTAEDHFAELRHHPSIDGEDDNGNLRFLESFLEDKFKWREGKTVEPTISLNAVRKALTRIRDHKRKG